MRYFRCSDKHHDLAFFAGDPGLKRISFELESEDEIKPQKTALSRACRSFTDIPAADCSAMATGPGVRTQEPVTGCTLDFYSSVRHEGISRG